MLSMSLNECFFLTSFFLLLSSDLNLFDDDVTEEDNTDELFAVKGDNQTSDLFSTDTSSTKRSGNY